MVAGILALRLAGVEQEAVWAEVVQRCSAARPALPVLVALVGVREHVMLVCRVAPMRRGRGGQQQQRDRHPRLLTVAAHCSLSTLISHCATAPVRTTLCCTRNTLLHRLLPCRAGIVDYSRKLTSAMNQHGHEGVLYLSAWCPSLG